MSSDGNSEIDQIIEHIEDRLIPTELKTGGGHPAWYKSEMSGRYEKRMRKRARRLLQRAAPKERASMLAFFEHEDEIRSLIENIEESKERLHEIGYKEESVRDISRIHDLLRSVRAEVASQSHADLMEEHPALGLFVGEKTDAEL